MRTRFVASFVAFTFFGAMVTSPLAARADTEEAKSHFQRAVELFHEADFRAALIEFQRAYDAAPNYKVLYNLGQTSLELQDYAGALKAFKGYLDGGGREIPAARRTQVEADLKRLDSRVARVEVSVNVEGADVTVDDVSVGRSPLPQAVLVGAGRRKIAATKAGLSPASRVVDVAGGDKPKVSLELVEQRPEVITVTTQPDGTQTQKIAPLPPQVITRTATGPSTAFWIGLGSTGVLAVGAGVLGALALSSKSTFDDRVQQVGVTTQQVDDARSQTRSFALATDIVGGVAIAAAVTTVVLAFTTRSTHVIREGAWIVPGGFAGTF
jgi:hypothetical protein